MKKNLMFPVFLIFLGISAIILSIAVIEPVVFETKWKNIDCWVKIGLAQNDGICEYDSSKDAIRLVGKDYKYMLKGEGGASLLDESKINDFPIFTCEINTNKQTFVYLKFKTTDGDKYIMYEMTDSNGGEYAYGTVRFGLGSKIGNGNSYVIYRDFPKDFKQTWPSIDFIKLESIIYRVNDEIFVRDIKFLSGLPEGAEITKPDQVYFSYQVVYDKNTKKKIWMREDDCNSIGELICYKIFTYSYSVNGDLKGYDIVWHDPSGELMKINTIQKDGNKDKMKEYDDKMNIKYTGIISYPEPGIIDWEDTYYYKDGNPWYIYNWYGNYIGSGSGYFKRTYKKSDGPVIKEISDEYIHDNEGKGNLVKSYRTVYDMNGEILSKENRYYIPGQSAAWVPPPQLFEKDDGSGIVIKGRNLWTTCQSIECDYNDEDIKGIRMVYLAKDNTGGVVERNIYTYDNKGQPKSIQKEKYDPWYASVTRLNEAPELLKEMQIEDLTKSQDPENPIIPDGDMQSNDVKTYREPINSKSGINPLYKKTKITINGKSQKALRIEKEYEEEEIEVDPVFLQQVIPVKENETYKLTFSFIRRSGTACIRAYLLSLYDVLNPDDLMTMNELIEKKGIDLIGDYQNNYIEGLYSERFTFTSMNEPCVLVIKIGAASIIDYTNIELKPYIPEPIITQEPPKQAETLPDEKPEESSVEGASQTENISVQETEESAPIVTDTVKDYINNTQVIVKEVYKDRPVLVGGYIIVNSDDDDNDTEDTKGVQEEETEILTDRRLPTPRTTKGEEIHNVSGEKSKIPAKEIRQEIPQFDRVIDTTSCEEAEISEDTTDKRPVTNSLIDRVRDTEMKNNLYPIKHAAIAPHTRLTQRGVEGKNPPFIIRGIYLGLKELIKNLLQEVKSFLSNP